MRSLGFAWVHPAERPSPAPALPPGAPVEALGSFPMTPGGFDLLAQARPDLLLVDLGGLPAEAPGALVAMLHARFPKAPILAFGPQGNDRIAGQALAAGAAAWLGDRRGPLEVLRAIHAVSTGTVRHGATGQRALRAMFDAPPPALGWTSIDPSATLLGPAR